MLPESINWPLTAKMAHSRNLALPSLETAVVIVCACKVNCVRLTDANCGMWRKEAAKPTLRRTGKGERNAKERESIRSNYAVHYPFPIDRVPRARAMCAGLMKTC